MAEEQKVVSSGLPLKTYHEEAVRLNRLLCLLKDMRELFEKNNEFLCRLVEDDGIMFHYARIGVWVWDYSRRAYTQRVWDNLITGVDNDKLEKLSAKVDEFLKRLTDANRADNKRRKQGGSSGSCVDKTCTVGDSRADSEDNKQEPEAGTAGVLHIA